MTDEIDLCKNMVSHLLAELKEQKRINNNLTKKINRIIDKSEKSLLNLNESWMKDFIQLESYCYHLESKLKKLNKINN
tara:strand:+ start:124 stop:357 length:234 start_codon:yes stop_codon:yes gene_type:complete